MRPEDVERRWIHIDVGGKVLGRAAVKIARVLMGKEKPTYTPGVDGGDFVVVTGASNVRVTGKKEADKKYYHHTGYLGHMREESLERVRARKPEKIVLLAVRRMLPKTRSGRAMLGRLKVYAGDSHPHAAQNPETIQVSEKKGEWHAAAK